MRRFFLRREFCSFSRYGRVRTGRRAVHLRREPVHRHQVLERFGGTRHRRRGQEGQRVDQDGQALGPPRQRRKHETHGEEGEHVGLLEGEPDRVGFQHFGGVGCFVRVALLEGAEGWRVEKFCGLLLRSYAFARSV